MKRSSLVEYLPPHAASARQYSPALEYDDTAAWSEAFASSEAATTTYLTAASNSIEAIPVAMSSRQGFSHYPVDAALEFFAEEVGTLDPENKLVYLPSRYKASRPKPPPLKYRSTKRLNEALEKRMQESQMTQQQDNQAHATKTYQTDPIRLVYLSQPRQQPNNRFGMRSTSPPRDRSQPEWRDISKKDYSDLGRLPKSVRDLLLHKIYDPSSVSISPPRNKTNSASPVCGDGSSRRRGASSSTGNEEVAVNNSEENITKNDENDHEKQFTSSKKPTPPHRPTSTFSNRQHRRSLFRPPPPGTGSKPLEWSRKFGQAGREAARKKAQQEQARYESTLDNKKKVPATLPEHLLDTLLPLLRTLLTSTLKLVKKATKHAPIRYKQLLQSARVGDMMDEEDRGENEEKASFDTLLQLLSSAVPNIRLLDQLESVLVWLLHTPDEEEEEEGEDGEEEWLGSWLRGIEIHADRIRAVVSESTTLQADRGVNREKDERRNTGPLLSSLRQLTEESMIRLDREQLRCLQHAEDGHRMLLSEQEVVKLLDQAKETASRYRPMSRVPQRTQSPRPLQQTRTEKTQDNSGKISHKNDASEKLNQEQDRQLEDDDNDNDFDDFSRHEDRGRSRDRDYNSLDVSMTLPAPSALSHYTSTHHRDSSSLKRKGQESVSKSVRSSASSRSPSPSKANKSASKGTLLHPPPALFPSSLPLITVKGNDKAGDTNASRMSMMSGASLSLSMSPSKQSNCQSQQQEHNQEHQEQLNYNMRPVKPSSAGPVRRLGRQSSMRPHRAVHDPVPAVEEVSIKVTLQIHVGLATFLSSTHHTQQHLQKQFPSKALSKEQRQQLLNHQAISFGSVAYPHAMYPPASNYDDADYHQDHQNNNNEETSVWSAALGSPSLLTLQAGQSRAQSDDQILFADNSSTQRHYNNSDNEALQLHQKRDSKSVASATTKVNNAAQLHRRRLEELREQRHQQRQQRLLQLAITEGLTAAQLFLKYLAPPLVNEQRKLLRAALLSDLARALTLQVAVLVKHALAGQAIDRSAVYRVFGEQTCHLVGESSLQPLLIWLKANRRIEGCFLKRLGGAAGASLDLALMKLFAFFPVLQINPSEDTPDGGDDAVKEVQVMLRWENRLQLQAAFRGPDDFLPNMNRI